MSYKWKKGDMTLSISTLHFSLFNEFMMICVIVQFLFFCDVDCSLYCLLFVCSLFIWCWWFVVSNQIVDCLLPSEVFWLNIFLQECGYWTDLLSVFFQFDLCSSDNVCVKVLCNKVFVNNLKSIWCRFGVCVCVCVCVCLCDCILIV